MNYSLLRAEQELYSKQPVREKPAPNPSENGLIDGVVPLHLARASESEIEDCLHAEDLERPSLPPVEEVDPFEDREYQL